MGDAASAVDNYAEALQYFDRAAEHCTEPGRLASKQATAYFYLGRYRDAERYYRCVLESSTPTEDQAAAHFNIGTTLLYATNGADGARLAEALGHFQQCLRLEPADSPLRRNCRHNFELTKLLWKQVSGSAALPPSPEAPGAEHTPGAGTTNPMGADDPHGARGAAANGKGTRKDGTPRNGVEPQSVGTGAAAEPGAGQRLLQIPEAEQQQPLAAAEARELVRQASARIARERRALHKNSMSGDNRAYPDW